MKQADKQQNSIYKRRKRKANMLARSARTAATTMIGRATKSLLLCLAFSSLLQQLFHCDISGHISSSIVVEAAEQQSEPPNKQRFLEEPKDTMVLFGHSADLACVIANRRGVRSWGKDDISIAFDTTIEAPYIRYSILQGPTGQQQQIQNGSDHEASYAGESGDPMSANVISNYTLHIENVTEDASYSCNVAGVDQQHRGIVSRSAKLTVLRPPTRLTVTQLSSTDGIGGDYYNSQSPNDNRDIYATSAAAAANQIDKANAPAAAKWPPESQAATDDTSAASASSAAAQPSDRAGEPVPIIVKQNSRLRLECRSDQAKPHAELVWLDNQQVQVAKRAALAFNGGADQTATSLAANDSNVTYAEELVRASSTATDDDSGENSSALNSKLSADSLVLSVKVQHHHANQVFTCVARHPAFEQQQLFSQLYGREPRRSVRLDVHYAPVIELIKDQVPVRENQPLKFTCLAHARPNELAYRWFIDDRLVANATEPELLIEKVTRQLHLREIKCEVRNQVDARTSVHKLAVLYAPAYVTHLLPASLQPELSADELHAGDDPHHPHHSHHHQQQHSHRHHRHRQHHAKQQQQFAHESNSLTSIDNQRQPVPNFALSRQLAIGFDSGEDVQLRCDFDSNPRLTQVFWYKVNTDYTNMKGVTTTEADELISNGAAHAIFLADSTSSRGDNFEAAALTAARHHHRSGQVLREHNKRHIVLNGGGEDTPSARSSSSMMNSLDYERMSADLLAELAEYEKHTAREEGSNGTSADALALGRLVEPIVSQLPIATNARIREPLAWVMTQFKQLQQQLQPFNGNMLEEAQATATIQNRLSLVSATQLMFNSSSFAAMTANGLNERSAQISSSIINLHNSNSDSIGKYICKARSSDGQNETARAVYLVMRQEPRVISSQEQWATSDELKIECLAQVHTVVDNMTTIAWYRNGKPIECSQAQTSGKNCTITWQRSPDLLFVRSVLKISGADRYDFGLYECTVLNSVGSDPMTINLKEAQTGFSFSVMAVQAIGTVLLFVCVAGLLIIFAPRRTSLDSKISMSAGMMTGGGSTGNANNQAGAMLADSEQSSQRSDRKSPQQSFGSQDDEGIVTGAQTDSDQQNCDNELVISNQQQQQQLRRQSVAIAANSMMISDQLNHNHHHACDHFDSSGKRQQQQQYASVNGLRSSIRQPMGQKYAAICETLEHHLGAQQPALKAPPHAPSTIQRVQTNEATGANTAVKGHSISELEQGSLVNRLWSRLLMRPATDRLGSGSRRIKSRPVISMPVSMARPVSLSSSTSAATEAGGVISAKRRPSLSTSLSIMGAAAGGANSDIGGATTSNIRGASHLVSSSANLIQDSTTASDGTASEGRSSSQSSGHNHNHQLQNHHHHLEQLAQAQNQLANNHLAHFAYLNNSYMQQHQHGIWIQRSSPTAVAQAAMTSDLSQNSGQVVDNSGMLDSSLYVNHDTGMMNAYYRDLSPSNQVNFYGTKQNGNNQTNDHSPFNANGDHRSINQLVGIVNGYANGQPLAATWTGSLHHHDSSHRITSANVPEHYQHPHIQHLNQSSYASYSSQQQPLGACYSKHAGQQQLVSAAINSANYSTLPMRPPSVQCHQMVVPTSDGGDAFFETNYGTLLSRSSANKTLGYAASSHSNSSSNATQQNGLNGGGCGSLSSSPNSMTTHANASNTVNLTSHHDHPTATTLVPEGDEFHLHQQQQLGDNSIVVVAAATTTTAVPNQVTMVQSNCLNGITTTTTTTATKILNDNGLATHV